METPLYPSLPSGVLSVEVIYRTDVAEFDAGSQVRSGRWARPRRRFKIAYEWLTPAEWQSILDLYHQQLGGLREFRFDDYSDTAPLLRTFGLGDGSTLVFWLQHDFTTGAIIYVDGAFYAGAYVDPDTGRVQFDVAPARGQVLTYSATAAGYRARFASDVLPYDRLYWGAFAQTVELEQLRDQQDIYPIRQVVCGGTITTKLLETIGDGIAFSFVCPCDVTVDDVSYYVPDYLDPGTVRASLCSDLNGAPGTVLGLTDDIPGALGWQSVSLAAPVDLLQGVRYWLTVAAHVGTWDGTHWCEVQYTETVPDPIPGEDQDDMLWGGYEIADQSLNNTPHSWLGVALKVGAGTWSLREPLSHPAFWLNSVFPVVGHCQAPLTQPVYDLTRTREIIPINTAHDMVIDRIGAVFSTNGAPADDLHYVIVWESDPAQIRTGILSAPVDTDGVPQYIEFALTQPFAVPVGETLHVVFYSAGSVVGAPWTHWGHKDSELDYALLWAADWDWGRWDGPPASAEISIDGGLTYPVAIRGAWTVRCRGVMTP